MIDFLQQWGEAIFTMLIIFILEVGRNFQLTGENNFNEIIKNENNRQKI